MAKTRTLRIQHGGWRCVVSGNDGEILTTLRILRQSFRGNTDLDETNVLQLVRGALDERKREKAEELIQGKFAIPYSEFLGTGKSRFPDDIFRNSMTEVELIQIDAEFLVVGFASDLFPTLIETSGTHAVIREDFAVCGEGASLAQASLMDRKHNSLFDFGRTVYSVFEAKRFAEGSPSVGEGTSMSVIHKEGKIELLTWDGIQSLEEHRTKFGRKKLPQELKIEPKSFKLLPSSLGDGGGQSS